MNDRELAIASPGSLIIGMEDLSPLYGLMVKPARNTRVSGIWMLMM